VSGQKRITVTLKVINNAVSVFFIVTGNNKARIVERIFEKDEEIRELPASYIIPVNGNTEWWLDENAGAFLK
jgi:6-phosphogluconolactonase